MSYLLIIWSQISVFLAASETWCGREQTVNGSWGGYNVVIDYTAISYQINMKIQKEEGELYPQNLGQTILYSQYTSILFWAPDGSLPLYTFYDGPIIQQMAALRTLTYFIPRSHYDFCVLGQYCKTDPSKHVI